MAYRPCNLPLDRLLEIHKEQRQRNHARRQSAMSGARMKPDTAKFLDRYEAAVQVALEKLIQLDATHPDVLEPTP